MIRPHNPGTVHLVGAGHARPAMNHHGRNAIVSMVLQPPFARSGVEPTPAYLVAEN